MTCEECARLNLLRKVVTDPVRRAQYENELVRHVNACHPEAGSLAAALWPGREVRLSTPIMRPPERGMTEVTIEHPKTRELLGGEIHPRGTGARLAAALKMLKSVEWSMLHRCSFCGEHEITGHAPDCKLVKLLEGEV